MLLFDFTVTSFIFVTIAVKVDESTTVCFIVFVCRRKEGMNCKQTHERGKTFATTNEEDISVLESKAKNKKHYKLNANMA